MKLFKSVAQAVSKFVMVQYHRRMASAYRKFAAHYADVVIHTQHRVPSASLAKMRVVAGAHDQKAKAIHIGE
ncbi:hypothetical protein IYR97_25690 (plasmid) [Pseudomonas fulva]|uniref:Uncharacterized protein n=3 Tax=Pseudomonas TaxID=286 RepID=A0A1X0ZHG0_PSEPU|nr:MULTISPECIES: hypothetical protein [Pseudomonas]MCT8162775.1 hypothetical protein [Pseudomonas sp. HD6422]MCT8181456.1 hypothetical protein [Pseudomonas sp. HD6421]MDH1928952.1 hypothetical protein [Pseudomonas sp. GD03696]MDM1712516.1 hypothetical protein [Pseudomonas sp. 165]ORL52093.1 hypothetical protein B7H18_08685 [Pseudomonas putida]